MDRPPNPQVVLVAPDAESPFVSEAGGSFITPEVDSALSKRDAWREPRQSVLSPERAATPQTLNDIREIYLKRHNDVATAAAIAGPAVSRLAKALWSSARSRVPMERRIVAGVGLVAVAVALLVGVTNYLLLPRGTTSDATGRLASAVSAVIGGADKEPAAPLTVIDPAATGAAASVASSRKSGPNARAAAQRNAIQSLRPLQVMPLAGTEIIMADGPGPIGADALLASNSAGATAVPTNDAVVAAPVEQAVASGLGSTSEYAIAAATIYSSDDLDVSPPVALRSPGLATDRGADTRYISYVEILVSETGRVESVKRRRQPSTLGAAFQSSTALSAVKTWIFRPAHKRGQPVKYRTVVPFLETLYPAGTVDGSR